jgi:hypothetical protein
MTTLHYTTCIASYYGIFDSHVLQYIIVYFTYKDINFRKNIHQCNGKTMKISCTQKLRVKK